MMTRRDFRAIAEVLAANRARGNPAEVWRVDTLARDLADYLATTNPRFDRERFLTAAARPPADYLTTVRECAQARHRTLYAWRGDDGRWLSGLPVHAPIDRPVVVVTKDGNVLPLARTR